MRILWFTNIPSPYRSEFLRQMAEHIEVTVVFHSSSASDRDDRWYDSNLQGCTLHFLDKKRTFLSKIKQLTSIIVNDKFDYIINCDYSNIMGLFLLALSKANGIKIMLEADGGIYKKRLINGIVRFIIGSHDGYFSSGSVTDEYFRSYGIKKEINRFHFSSMTQKEINNNLKMSDQRNNQKDKVILLAIGQFIPRKGFDLLLKAFKTLDKHKYELILIGGKAENLIEFPHMKNVRIYDFMSKKELAKYFVEANVFIIPSREDIWGLVVNEAISFNLPIISSEFVMASKELSKHSKGIHFYPNNDWEKLRDKIIEVSNSMIEVDYSYVNGIYTIEEMVENHIDRFLSR